MARRTQGGSLKLLAIFLVLGALALIPVWAGYKLLTFLEGVFIAWGPSTAGLFTWLVNAPNEELIKWLVFVGATKALKSLKKPADGWWQGAVLGLGYGLAENVFYIGQAGLGVFALRLVTAVPGHIFYGALWGGYYGWEVYQGKGMVRRWTPVLLALFVAIVFHAAYNSALSWPLGVFWAVFIEAIAGALALTLGWVLTQNSHK